MFGYGEDALTMWVLETRIDEFLRLLDDPVDGGDPRVFYRPSFGRQALAGRAEFGEFDAIVSTQRRIYLVEAKWDGSQEIEEGVVRLRPEQVRRHRIFRWYVEQWHRSPPTTWDHFHEAASKEANEFSGEFPMTVPRSGTKLAKNLEFVLRTVHPQSQIEDVLLMVTLEKKSPIQRVEPDFFRLVTIHAQSVGGAGFISLGRE